MFFYMATSLYADFGDALWTMFFRSVVALTFTIGTFYYIAYLDRDEKGVKLSGPLVLPVIIGGIDILYNGFETVPLVIYLYFFLFLTIQLNNIINVRIHKNPLKIDSFIHILLITLSCGINLDMAKNPTFTSCLLGIVYGTLIMVVIEEYSGMMFRYEASERINLEQQVELDGLHRKMNRYGKGQNSMKIKNELIELQEILETISKDIPEGKYIVCMEKTKNIYNELKMPVRMEETTLLSGGVF